jgi:hypothetical protein
MSRPSRDALYLRRRGQLRARVIWWQVPLA